MTSDSRPRTLWQRAWKPGEVRAPPWPSHCASWERSTGRSTEQSPIRLPRNWTPTFADCRTPRTTPASGSASRRYRRTRPRTWPPGRPRRGACDRRNLSSCQSRNQTNRSPASTRPRIIEPKQCSVRFDAEIHLLPLRACRICIRLRLCRGSTHARTGRVPIRLLAGGVAYSRVHTGVHYPGDVAIGSILGAGTAAIVAAAADGISRSHHRESISGDGVD